jgi:hypothetical protein
MKRPLSYGRFLALAGLILSFSACAPPAVVFLNARYQAAHVQRVALIGFEDYPGMAGSGKIVGGIFEKYLLLGNYSLVDQRQVAAVLEKQSLDPGANMDAQEIQSLGKLLGVDALVFGQVTGYSDSSDRTVVVDMPLEQTQPIFGQVITVQHSHHGEEVKTVQDVVTGYSSTTTDTPVQQTETVYAHVGLSVRLIDANSGDLLWSASSSGIGGHLNEAAENVSSQVMKTVFEKVKKEDGN